MYKVLLKKRRDGDDLGFQAFRRHTRQSVCLSFSPSPFLLLFLLPLCPSPLNSLPFSFLDVPCNCLGGYFKASTP